MQKACQKRNISVNTLEEFVDELERELQETGEKEIPSSVVGERIMTRLHELDAVAYVRFASVYREFKDINDFMSELKDLLDAPRRKSYVPDE
jgi:transcriptional repressor NrdR